MASVTGTITIGGVSIRPGERASIDLPVPSLSTHAPMTMPLQVLHGRRPGPTLFVCAAIHGDEINGTEIIRRLLRQRGLRRLRGTLLAVPVVNVFGFISLSRYLPDRRDLNRSFPGSPHGSLAARIAHLFMSEIVGRSTHGIDLHTGAATRTNLPHVRANLNDEENLRLARAFGAPVMLNATNRERSLRHAAEAAGIPLLVYEAGEALRFDEIAIGAGVHGVVNVMRALGMLAASRSQRTKLVPALAQSAGWVRAPQSGILRAPMRLGAHVAKGQTLGVVADPFGENELEIVAHEAGIILGRTTLPLVQEGDALFHIVSPERKSAAVTSLATFEAEFDELDRRYKYG